MDYLRIFALILFWHFCNGDNLALLSGTLRTYQKAGCEDDVVTLNCPQGTTISVEVAQYGQYGTSRHLCPVKTSLIDSDVIDHSTPCLWSTALQYSLLQTVVEACQKKSTCQFQASPLTFEGDPCPGKRKYVEVAYKCRPAEFRSRVACENERIQLQCNPNFRVAIYSASYGRTDYESSQCPQPQGVAEENCLVSYATETVMLICHGKRRCEISADASTLGNPCKPQTRMYLRIAYTCVPRNVLNKQYEGPLESDEVDVDQHFTQDQGDFASFDPTISLPPVLKVEQTIENHGIMNMTKSTKGQDLRNSRNKTLSARTKHIAKNATLNHAEVHYDESNSNSDMISVTPGERDQIIGLISAWINTYTYVSKNQERFYIYLLVSTAAALFLCIVVIISRILLRRRREKHAAQGHSADAGDGSIAHGFVDDISEVDADITLTPPSDVVMHTHFGGRLGSFSTEMPRSVSHAAASVYYYG